MNRRRILATSTAIAALVALPPAAGAAGPLQPGSYASDGVSSCTLNFVFDGTSGPYIGTAAHCFPVGARVRDWDGDEFGTVVAAGDEDNATRDWAMIRVDSEDRIRLSAGVAGHPTVPTGVGQAGEASFGALVQISGWGLGFDLTQITREQRVGLLGSQTSDTYTLTGPTIFGDSGGPLTFVSGGRALGIVSRLCIGVCTDIGPTVQGILAQARTQLGSTLRLRTAG